jgi:predicted DNA-binding transcriptional regulator AlpA
MSPTITAAGTPADGPMRKPPLVMLDVHGFADVLDCSTRHVRRLVDAGKAPQPVRLGGCVRWPLTVVEAWIADGCPNCRKRPGVAR